MKTNLQALRKRAGYKNAKAFAEYLGLSKDTYTGYEQGRIALTLEGAWELADALSCSLDELAGRGRPDEDGSADSDPRQQQLNCCYRLLNDESRRDMLGIAASFEMNPTRLVSVSGADSGDDVVSKRAGGVLR